MTAYYVKNGGDDGAAGTSDGTAWATLAKVGASSFSAGDAILFKRGDVWLCTATERLVVPSSGSAGSPITFGEYGTGSKPQFDGQTTSGILVYANNRNYLTFDNLDLYRSGNYGMQVLGTSQNIIVQNCVAQYSYHSGMVFDTGTAAILVDLCSIHHNHQTGTFHEAVTFTGVNGFEIRYSSVYANTKEGIDAKYGSTNGLIHHNTCYSNLLGIYIDAANTIDVYDNVIYSNAANKPGLGIAAEDLAPRTAYAINVYNNLIYLNNRGIDFWIEVPATGTIHDINILNNTLHGNGTNGGLYLINYPTGGYSAIVIRNNIFWENTDKEIRGASGFAGFTIDHNLFKTGSASDSFGTDAVTTADVLFTNEDGHSYSLTVGSPAIDAGSATGAPATDHTGLTRPQGAGVDIGAYEYLPVPEGVPVLVAE